MRRRERVDPSGAPERLRRFRASDWTGQGCHPECVYWSAVQAWLAVDADRTVDIVAGPDVPFHPELI